MKKKINKKKVPSYAFGIDQGIQAASFLGAGIQGLADEGSGLDVAGGTLSGAASAAGLGASVAGPYGAVIGGALGAVGGLITGKRKQKQLRYQKLRKKITDINQYNDAIEANLNNLYAEENDPVYTFENGGVLPDLAYVDNNEVLRDYSGNITQVPNTKPGTDNHLIDASNLDSVLSDKIKRPGTNKTFAQEGKELVKMTKRSKGKDRFARNADKLNQINANAMYEDLLAEQEAVKIKKGVKPKVKGIPAYEGGKEGKLVRWGDIKHLYDLDYDTNDVTRLWLTDHETLLDVYGKQVGRAKKRKVGAGYYTEAVREPVTVAPTRAIPEAYGWAYKNANTRLSTPTDPVKLIADRKEYWKNNDLYYADQLPEVQVVAKAPENPTYMKYVQKWDPRWSTALVNAQQKDNAESPKSPYSVGFIGNTPGLFGPVLDRGVVDSGVDGITGETIPVNESTVNLPEVAVTAKKPTSTTRTATTGTTTTGTTKTAPAKKEVKIVKVPEQAKLLDIEDFNPTLTPDGIYAPMLDVEDFNPELKPVIKNKPSFDFGNLAGLSPVLYNWVQSMRNPEVEDQVLNPYSGAINRTMASRRLNIAPTLAANRRSRAMSRYNIANLNPNTGMNLAYGNQAAAGEYAQNATTYANRDNVNNQYLGEYANMMNNLGQQYIQNTVLTNDLNARNRAAARNFGSTAVGQLGKWSQVKQLERNQAKRDKMILPALQEFLKSYYPTDTYNKMFG